jgi:diguanylate cyclase (GGDEF)-like protein
MWATILSKQVWYGELVNRRKDGSLYHEEMTITPMLDNDGKIDHFVAIKQDITERKQMEDVIHDYAFYDTLTHLPNRRLFMDRLTQAQSISKRSGQYGAVMFLDLDNFKTLNDTYGHSVGDLLLVEAAHRVKVSLRDSDTVARFGGDEFVVLLSLLSTNIDESIQNAEIIAEKIRSTIAQSYFLTVGIEGHQEKIVEHLCTSSIGVVLFLEYETSQDDILKYADEAMYQSKESGRNKVLFYKEREE